ncbi:MAG: PSD1 domain-containing protein [Pirellulaceae bacterium]|nr:PSD1 domain-containing protein [Pirellulaceae bacterium]
MKQLLTTLCVVGALGLAVNAVRAQQPDAGSPPGAAKQPGAASQPDRAGLEFFETKIRPVLTEHCYACHSAAAAEKGKLRGGLLLDTREATRQGGESGPAVVPGQPDESLLLSALRHEAFEMPPKGKLPEAVIADFARWIELGAPDPRDGKPLVAQSMIDIEAGRAFWSFQPLAQVEPPQAADDPWVRTPIDAWIRARQQAAGIRPNPPAEARILIRRAWFDLLGLPPAPEELDAWTARLTAAGSAEPAGGQATFNHQVWAELVDHLLASPHYGERWARHWLDVARFAESHGYEQDYDRPNAYHYRDFLIRAFNQDLPYDKFVEWQLAGDELAADEPLAWMATGFLGGGAFPTQLTEAEFESARYDELDDMAGTTGLAFLGLSVGCARCHDHKFDPIPARDYYRLAACFTTAIRSEREFDLQPEENARRRREHQQRLQQLRDALAKFETEQLPGKFTQWLADYDPAGSGLSAWELLNGQVQSTGGSKFRRQPDGSYLAEGPAPDKDELTFRAVATERHIAAFRLEALADPTLPRRGPGRAANGNFALGDFQVIVTTPGANATPRDVKLVQARATHQQNDGALSVAASIDDDPISGWAVDGQIGRDQAAVFVAAEPVELRPGDELAIRLVFNHPNTRHAIGRFRLAVSSLADAPVEVGGSGPDQKIVEALRQAKAGAAADSAAWRTAIDWFKTTLSEWQQLHNAVNAQQQAGPKLELAKVLVTSEGLPHLPHHADGRGFPHFYPQTFQLRRGDVHQKEQPVEPGYLQVLMRDGQDETNWRLPPPDEARTSYRRAGLARWITDVNHGAGHLAARVMVNRLWQHHFGRGLVATPNDFGASGERPTHPELLDWLAARLIAEGWRLKPVHKLIMTSGVYLQSSDYNEQAAQADRENQLLWRYNARRLEAEPIRDAMLAVAGQLDPTMFGPGTLDQNMRRRSVYFFIKRSQLIPMMMLFDWPEHLVSIGQRSSTTIAPQALMFMNSSQGRSFAEGFAGRLAGLPAPEAIERAYRLAFGRSPTAEERQLAERFLHSQADAHQQAGRADGSRLALIDLCQTLLSMNEFVYVE